jgi:chaperonin GroEL
MKLVKIGTEARNELMVGANFLADAVKRTLGPFGQNFFLEKGDRVTNDGVSIAQEIELKDEIQQRGVYALRKASIKTNDEAGDGTTSAIVLAQAILKDAVRNLGDDQKGIAGKKTPSEVIKQIETERLEIEEKLNKMAKPIKTVEQLVESARVSVENDELAKLIGETQWELGKDGIIIAEETAEETSSIEKIHGIRIDNGFGTSHIINNQEKQLLEVKDARVIMTNHTLGNLKPVENVINQLLKTGTTNIIIVARAFTNEAIAICLENIKQGNLKIFPINAPYTNQSEIMKDMAATLGGTFYDAESSSLEDMQLSDVGFASKLIARRYDAIFTGKNNTDKRIEELKEQLKGSQSDFEKKQLQERIAQMTNGFAIIKVGANSETERKYKFDKVTDGVNAVRYALKEGVVDGAGLAFKQISEALPDTYLLKRPLLSIYEQIMFSAPKEFIIADWVKDPVFVLKTILKHACSVAGTLATVAGVTATEKIKPRYVEEVKND